MKVVLLVNWGLGLEILKVIHSLPDFKIVVVGSQNNKIKSDKWANSVYDFSRRHGYRAVGEDNISFSYLRDEIVKSGVDLLVTHAFMKILPRKVFMAPKYGSINIHPSLLPKYRGPSPTYWVLKNKEKITGLTCHYIDEGVDTGNIIYQVKVPVKLDDNIGSIIDRQKTVVEELIVESLFRIMDSSFQPTSQESELATYAPRPDRKEC